MINFTVCTCFCMKLPQDRSPANIDLAWAQLREEFYDEMVKYALSRARVHYRITLTNQDAEDIASTVWSSDALRKTLGAWVCSICAEPDKNVLPEGLRRLVVRFTRYKTDEYIRANPQLAASEFEEIKYVASKDDRPVEDIIVAEEDRKENAAASLATPGTENLVGASIESRGEMDIALRKAAKKLSKRERQYVNARWFLGIEDPEVLAQKLGMSRGHLRATKKRALDKLRKDPELIKAFEGLLIQVRK